MNDIELLIKKAKEDIESAKALFELGYYRISVSRSYYAMFYIAEAILLSKGFSYSSHHAVISFFNKEFVKTGIFEKKYYDWLETAFKLRENGDYEVEPIITKDHAQDLVQKATKFLQEAQKYLSSTMNRKQ